MTENQSDSFRFLPLSPAVEKGLEKEATVNDFDFIQDIGSGGYGAVKLFKHKQTGFSYAIKQISKLKFENKLQKVTFCREVEIMYKINHPNIVKLYTHFEDESDCYLVMEYIKGGNLYDYMLNQPNKVVDARTCAQFVTELVSALYYMHNMSPPIIHRDIKPENLLLHDDGTIKLADFGASNFFVENAVRFTKVGTEFYQAPELITSKGYDNKIDIWDIGILMFELLTGQPPFKKDTYSMEDNIKHLRIKWPKAINISAKNLILKILKIDPNARLSLAEIMKHQFIIQYIPEAEKKLISPSMFKHIPFVISQDSPDDLNIIKEDDSDADDNEGERITDKERSRLLEAYATTGKEVDFGTAMNLHSSITISHRKEGCLNKQARFKHSSTIAQNQRDNEDSPIITKSDEFRQLYEKLKIDYDKLMKSYDELSVRKMENVSTDNPEVIFLKEVKTSLKNELDIKDNSIRDYQKVIARLEEEIKFVKGENETLKNQLMNVKKDALNARTQYTLKLETILKELSYYKEKDDSSMSRSIDFNNNTRASNMSKLSSDVINTTLGTIPSSTSFKALIENYQKEIEMLKKDKEELNKVIEKRNVEISKFNYDTEFMAMYEVKKLINSLAERDKIINERNETIEELKVNINQLASLFDRVLNKKEEMADG